MKVSSLFVLFSLLAALSCSPGQEPLESEQEEPLPIIDMHLHAFSCSDLLQQVQADFKKIREPLNFLTLIPEGQQAPKAIR